MRKASTTIVLAALYTLSTSQSALANPSISVRNSFNYPVKVIGVAFAVAVGVPINIAKKTTSSLRESANEFRYAFAMLGPSPRVAKIVPKGAVSVVVSLAKGIADGCDNAVRSKSFSRTALSFDD